MGIRYAGQVEFENGRPNHIGRSATGSMTIDDGSDAVVGGFEDSRSFRIGNESGGDGTVEISGRGSSLRFDGRDDGGYATTVSIGYYGQGSLIVRDGARYVHTSRTGIPDSDLAFLGVGGRDSGNGNGSIFADDGSLRITGGSVYASINGNDARSAISLIDGSDMTLDGAKRARLNVNSESGLYLASGSSLDVSASDEDRDTSGFGATVDIGMYDGTAAVTVEDSRLSVKAASGSASVDIGGWGSTYEANPQKR